MHGNIEMHKEFRRGVKTEGNTTTSHGDCVITCISSFLNKSEKRSMLGSTAIH